MKNSTGVDEYGIEAKVYPNPTNGILNIEADGLQRITVSNVFGQIVYDTEIEADMAQVNMNPFGQGVYVIRLYTTNGIGTRRVSVTK